MANNSIQFHTTRSGLTFPLPSKDEIARDPIRHCCRTGDVSKVRELKERLLAEPPKRISSLVGTACSYGHTDLVRLFLEWGVDPNSSLGDSDETLLHVAVASKYADIVNLLLDFKANPDQRDAYGTTPLSRAAAGSLELLKLLIGRGASLEAATTRQGWSVLHIAAAEGNVEIIKELIAAGASVESRNNLGATPLIQAAMAGKVEAVRALLSAGAKCDVVDKTGKSALGWAQANRRDDVVSLLSKAV